MPMSRVEAILAGKLKKAEREIKGLGKMAIRQFSSEEQDVYLGMRASVDQEVRGRAKSWLIAQCCLDLNGNRLFVGDSDVEILAKQFSAETIDAMLNEVLKLSDADAEAEERVGEGSGETSGNASASDSASPTESLPPS